LVLRACAQTYDMVADFSTTSNPNGVWSYRFQPGTSRDGNYALLPDFGPASGSFAPIDPDTWRAGSDVPAIGLNQTGSDAYYQGVGFVWPNGAILMHPGNISLVIASWEGPFTMSVNINFSFSSLDPNGGNGIVWFVERNNSSGTLSTGSYSDGGASGAQRLNAVPVSAGDRINFIVDPNGDYGYDSTQLTATISAVPGTARGPQLRIARSATDLLIWWPTNSADFLLESSVGLGSNQNWSLFAGPIITVGDEHVAAADTATRSKFFRLRKP